MFAFQQLTNSGARKSTIFDCQRTDPIAGSPDGHAIFHKKEACNALILHFLIACQAKQGAVVDVLWNQQCCGIS